MNDIHDIRVLLLPITKITEEKVTDQALKEVVDRLYCHNIEAALENNYDFGRFFKPKNPAKTRDLSNYYKK